MFSELQSERLRFRFPRESDLDARCAFFDDPVTQSVYKRSFTRDEVLERIRADIQHWHDHGFGRWVLEDKISGNYAGHAGLLQFEGHDTEIAYALHPAFRGRGLVVEAARRVRDHGYGELKFNRLVCCIRPGNTNSIRVAEKLGAKAEGSIEMLGLKHTVYLITNPYL